MKNTWVWDAWSNGYVSDSQSSVSLNLVTVSDNHFLVCGSRRSQDVGHLECCPSTSKFCWLLFDHAVGQSFLPQSLNLVFIMKFMNGFFNIAFFLFFSLFLSSNGFLTYPLFSLFSFFFFCCCQVLNDSMAHRFVHFHGKELGSSLWWSIMSWKIKQTWISARYLQKGMCSCVSSSMDVAQLFHMGAANIFTNLHRSKSSYNWFLYFIFLKMENRLPRIFIPRIKASPPLPALSSVSVMVCVFVCVCVCFTRWCWCWLSQGKLWNDR